MTDSCAHKGVLVCFNRWAARADPGGAVMPRKGDSGTGQLRGRVPPESPDDLGRSARGSLNLDFFLPVPRGGSWPVGWLSSRLSGPVGPRGPREALRPTSESPDRQTANWCAWPDDRYTPIRVRSIVAMNPTGRLTLPADVRRALGLRGDAFFEVHLEANAIVLKPVAIVPLETVQAQAGQQPTH